MKKEKFTKEEIEAAKTLYDKWILKTNTSITFKGFLDSLLEPERKKIVVEIEYQAQINLNASKVQGCMESSSCYYDKNALNFKVTELPEVNKWSDADMIEFAKFYMNHQHLVGHIMDNFKAERKSK